MFSPTFTFTGHSPIYTHVTTTLQGMVSIRVHGKQDLFTQIFDEHFDAQTAAFYFLYAGIFFFNLCMDLLGYFIFLGTLVAGLVIPKDGKDECGLLVRTRDCLKVGE